MSSEKFHRDWITIWQSEMAAAAADPELAELCLAMMETWSRAWDLLRPPPRDGRPSGGTTPWADVAAGAASAVAPSDARDGPSEDGMAVLD